MLDPTSAVASSSRRIMHLMSFQGIREPMPCVRVGYIRKSIYFIVDILNFLFL